MKSSFKSVHEVMWITNSNECVTSLLLNCQVGSRNFKIVQMTNRWNGERLAITASSLREHDGGKQPEWQFKEGRVTVAHFRDCAIAQPSQATGTTWLQVLCWAWRPLFPLFIPWTESSNSAREGTQGRKRTGAGWALGPSVHCI